MALDTSTAAQKQALSELGFGLTAMNGEGRYQSITWSNEKFSFTISYDTGYYDGHITILKDPSHVFTIVHLLRYLKNDTGYLHDELAEKGMYHSLRAQRYYDLMIQNAEALNRFADNYTPLQYEQYITFAESCSPYW